MRKFTVLVEVTVNADNEEQAKEKTLILVNEGWNVNPWIPKAELWAGDGCVVEVLDSPIVT